MRILISKEERKKLICLLKEKYNATSLLKISERMNVPARTLQNWIYERNYIPKEKVPAEILDKLTITEEKEDNWGSVKGGRKTYQAILEKYGLSEIRKRQSNGGRKSILALKNKIEKQPLQVDLSNPKFLEFYGMLVGDGWLSRLKNKNKTIHLIGISGHKELDKELHIYCKDNIEKMFQRKPYLKEIHHSNARELLFCHTKLFNFLVKDLNFPIGKKKDISLPKQISSQGYGAIKHVIRGMFDTDGSFYLDKTPAGHPYPCICITMKQPTLINQVKEVLLFQGFKVQSRKDKYPIAEIKLKGSKQLKKWLEEIGSSNPYKLRLMQRALVAQLDSAMPS